MWVFRQDFHESLQAIGQRFGGVSIGTVSDSLRHAETLLKEQPAFGDAIDAIRKRSGFR